MYIHKHFEVTDIIIIHDLIRAYPLGTLISYTENHLNANHIPFHLTETQPYGLLQGRLARANPLVNDTKPDLETLVVFNGPNAYISPSWYASKQESGKVVPTWNYVAVHAYGKLKIIDDADWLLAQLNQLTNHNESQFSEPWMVADAPKEFTEKLLPSIVGIEMKITKLLGKWKVSQNQPTKNQNSVINGLESSNKMASSSMAALIKARTTQS